MVSLLVLACIVHACVFFGYDLSLARRISWIDNGFSYPFRFLDNKSVVGFILLFLIGTHVPYASGSSY